MNSIHSLLLIVFSFLILPGTSDAQTTCRIYCPDGGSVVEACDADEGTDPCGVSSGSDNSGNNGYDYGASQREQEAVAAERQRQIEAVRIETERLAEEKRQKDAEFIRDRDAAANTLKGSTGPAMNQLKGLSGNDDFGLKSSGFDSGSELKSVPRTNSPSGDPMVVDARNLSSGLPKDVDNAIATAYANAPPGVSERVSKGFQAVMAKDWKVAKAWFEDALNRDPNNMGLKNMVALTDASQQTGQQAGSQLQLPDPDDVYLLFPGLEQPTPKVEVKPTNDVYIHNPSKGYKRVTREEAILMEIWEDIYGIPHLEQIPVYNPNFSLPDN